jgi:hypothetical protein
MHAIALKRLLALLCASAGAASAAPPLAGFVPYKDTTQGQAAGQAHIVWRTDRPALPEAVWAFASGECGQERWGPVPGPAFAAVNLPAPAGQRYWVSTGGAEGRFTCPTLAGLRAFVARYDGPGLQGIDFDIERDQSADEIDALVRHAATLAAERPTLRWMFTLATHAASDGSRTGLNGTGEAVMAALQRHRFRSAWVNLMVMNYGPALPAYCVVRPAQPGAAPARCDMAASALQAQANLAARHGWPATHTALTAMLGVNDVVDNQFTPDDARALQASAARAGVAGLFAWSLDRDGPCPAGEPLVSPRCHGLAGLPAGAFFNPHSPTPRTQP